MIDIKSIQSLTDFKRNTTEHLTRLRKSRSPLVLTVNGKAECVVLDADSYQELVDRIEYAESVRAIQEGIDSFTRGEGLSADEALADMAVEYGVSS
jgi:PHD/YefM family antitoxin component YafN of YafNO toxin-antitoxin module